MGYLEERSIEITELHNVYNGKTSELIKKMLEVPELLRLSGISQSCGTELSKFGIFQYKYSRLDHSVGVALILDNFVKDDKTIIAGMLHDIASPAFAHCVDFMHKDYINQEVTEEKTYDKIIGSDMLFEYFLNNEISINEVCDYSIYPLADSEKPKLCADRLEYLLHGALYTGLCTLDEIKELYDDLVIVPNEDSKPEFAFETLKLGEKFCRISIEMGKKYRSYESKITMQMIADLISLMIKRGEITEADLYKYSDRTIIEIGINSSYKNISEGWKKLMQIDKVYTRFTPIEDLYCKKIIAKSRYVDPLVRVKGGYDRVSNCSSESKQTIDSYMNSDTDLYAYVIDFNLN